MITVGLAFFLRNGGEDGLAGFVKLRKGGNEVVVDYVIGAGVGWISFRKGIANLISVTEDKDRIPSQVHVDGAEIVMTGSP